MHRASAGRSEWAPLSWRVSNSGANHDSKHRQGNDEWWFEDCRREDNADAETDLLEVAADVVDLCTEAERSPRRVAAGMPERLGAKSLDLFSGESVRVEVS